MNGISTVDLLSNSSLQTNLSSGRTSTDRTKAFESLLQAAKSMLDETSQLEKAANKEEMNYALGLSDNAHDLQIAQQKANIAIQYTVAIRNNVVDAYKQIMNLQF